MAEKQWYFLIFDLERSKGTDRVAFFRSVSKTGITRVQNSVYAVKAGDDEVEDLMRLAQMLKSAGADVIVLRGGLCSVPGTKGSPEDDLIEMMGSVLDGRYEKIRNEARAINDEVKKLKAKGEAIKYIRRVKEIKNRFDDAVKTDARDVISNKRNLADAEITDVVVALQKFAQ